MSTSSIEVMGSDLTKSDLEQLAQSGISARTAGSAMLRRVDSEAGANIVGRKDNGKYAGIIIPYIWPGRNTRANIGCASTTRSSSKRATEISSSHANT